MNDQVRDIIKRWFEKSEEQSNVFDKFISLWISFNAFYANNHLQNKECEQLCIFIDKYERLVSETKIFMNPVFKQLYNYINTDKIPKGYIQNLRYKTEEKRKNEGSSYARLDSFKDFIFVVYQIRCNLFHGGKNTENGQDIKLVSFANNALLTSVL